MVITCVMYVIMGSACTPLVMGGTRAGGRARGVYPRVYPPLWIVFSRGSIAMDEKTSLFLATPRWRGGARRRAARGDRAVGRRRARARARVAVFFYQPSTRRARRDWRFRTRRPRRSTETPDVDASSASRTGMASRVLANLLVAGGAALARAASQAYRQALANAQRTGVASEAANAASGARGAFGRKAMTAEEARLVLGVEASATYAEVLARYERLFASNEKGGSFYLQSKVYRARESLEREYDEETVRREREAAAARRDGTQRVVEDGREAGGGGASSS